MKMKTYVIIVSRSFPSAHKRIGEQTAFVDKVLSGDKLHTIRSNYLLWRKRFDEIEKGNACLSLRYWSGLPYRSKQVEFLRLTKEDGIGIQKLDFINAQFNSMYVDGLYCFADIDKSIAKNDGLSFDDFKAWFDNYDLSKPMAIIHFSKFRY